MKSEYSNRPEKLEAKLNTQNHDQSGSNVLLNTGVSNLLKRDYLYGIANSVRKQDIMS
jgi:hypothetical protein